MIIKFLSSFFYIFTSLLIVFSCRDHSKDIKPSSSYDYSADGIIVNSVTIDNDQLILYGFGLNFATTVRIVGPSGFDEIFTTVSKTNSTILANSSSAISFEIGANYGLTVYGTNGIATYPLSFSIGDNDKITASKLNSMGASIGQVLRFNGSNWTPDNLSGLIYAGEWNASTNSPNLFSGGNASIYYIVTTAGSTDLWGGIGTDSWQVGDWAIWNDVLGRWEKVDNSASNVQSIAGRSGEVIPAANDLTWAQIDKSGSSLSNIADIDSSDLTIGDLLKWDGFTWTASDDSNASITYSTPLVSSGEGTPTIQISLGSNSTSGYLSSTDWNTFNNKQEVLTTGSTLGYLRGNGTLGTFAMDVLDSTISGYYSAPGTLSTNDSLSAAISKLDGNIISLEPTLATGDLSESTSSVLTITNGTNAVVGSGTTIEVAQASSTSDGYITDSDWDTFDQKLDVFPVDNTTLEMNGSTQLQVKDGGVGSTKRITTLEATSGSYIVALTDNNKNFLVTGSSTVTLPSAISAGSGFAITVINNDATGVAIIEGESLESIDGQGTIQLTSQYAFATIISNGSDWFKVDGHNAVSAINCPPGFIPISGNSNFFTSDFCVMKYEAKDDNNTPGSVATGTPWIDINALNAQAECESIIESGFFGTFTLISNREWMTIARDIESVSSNWSSGTVGTGELARGWSASVADDGFANTNFAPSTDSNCLYNTAADTCASAGTHRLRRTHRLTNGNEIWDFAGNAREWVDWSTGTLGFTSGPVDTTPGGWYEIDSLSGSLIATDIQSLNGYNSAEETGQWFGGTGGAAIRGGDYNDGTPAGIFSLDLSNISSYSDGTLGIRCVYRP